MCPRKRDFSEADVVEIPRGVLRAIHQHVEDAYPDEGCGFLLGHRQDGEVVVEQEVPVENRRSGEAARRRYVIAADDYRRTERDATAAGLELLGTYHSHPDHPAVPSAYDRDVAWPWYRYLIVAVARGKVRGQRAWELTEDRSDFIEHPISLKEH